ncbi:hypothetical protein L210DRAFT_3536619 [Boletus edulis BED1]|uniref:Galactose oxidase n=1 Tax=Boletus edulis BED1 TaxID=1328754 RepID=A0AAD4BXR7_BOLED|nr:hypothetical protein L210DRAFT_3536619 [Boletus edulis BED1]
MFLQVVTYSLYFLPIALAQYTPSPRWAQAVTLLENTLYVHGGLSDPFDSYTYSSAPPISDILVLDLSTSFNSSSPPWQHSSSHSSPALAWHTLSEFNPTEILLFGGQPGPNSLTVLTDLNDSSYLFSTSGKSGPSFLSEPQNWANEPVRRIRHSSSYTSGKVWLIGGEKADGSGNAFSDHYYFSPSGPEFVQLPSSSSAPPDIYGHASLALPDGRLLVLGGYCASCSDLVPMNTVWSLDTTQNTLVWEKLSISNKSLPSPRRDFAAVVLSNGQVLIHGGGDTQLQATYSDGWILDTGQNPMVWNGVAALTQLGQRKDHSAVLASGCVLFCFGYGSSSPASASLFIYDPTTSSMVTSYAAPSPGSMSATPSYGPWPTQTGWTPNSKGGTGAPVNPTGAPSHVSGPSSSSSQHTAAIALGTTFGVLGLVVGGLATVYYMRRVRNRDRRTTGIFVPLAADPELSSSGGSVSGVAPEAAHFEGQINERVRGDMITDILAHLGITKFRSSAAQPRRDMFADEDARSFGWVGHSSTVQRQGSEGTSVWSFRSVGALVRGVIGSEPSGSGVNQGGHEWEKIDHHREEGQEGLIHQGSLHSHYSSHPTHRKDDSGSFWTQIMNQPVLRSNGTDNSEQTALAPSDSVWPFSARSHTLSPLREVSHVSLSDAFNSLPSLQERSQGQTTHSHADKPALPPPPNTPPTPHSPTASRTSDPHLITSVPQCSTISGSILSRSQSMSRPDSWWSRLTKPPLLDRRASITTSKPVDFRDPIPAPPFIMSEETKKSSPTLAHSNDTLSDSPAEHGRSLSSAHTGRTANTASVEHLGGIYDVVQRLASDGSSSRRAPSLGSAEITEQGMLTIDNPAPSEISMSSGLPHVDPPRSTLVPVDPAVSLDMEMPFQPLEPSKLNPASPQKGQTPIPRNTRRREEAPSRSRPTIQYGVAPRASLFIANPDLRHIS